jgi:hypothetical protein
MISTETVFHFTSSKEILISILENDFYPNYCFERCPLNKKVLKGAFPMVSFCDIPLSQIEKHIETYGHYGIGLSKDWAREKGLGPVLYLTRKSILSRSIEDIVVNILKLDPHEESEVESMRLIGDSLRDTVRYMKPYEGKYLKEKMWQEEKKFYDEREWRYIPPKQPNIKFALTESEFQNPQIRSEANSNVRRVTLSFKPPDIKYIILDKEAEILGFVTTLRNLKGQKYDRDIVNVVTTRVITCDQISKDF